MPWLLHPLYIERFFWPKRLIKSVISSGVSCQQGKPQKGGQFIPTKAFVSKDEFLYQGLVHLETPY